VVNDDLDRASREVAAIIAAARAGQQRRRALAQKILDSF
jgi:hypothetical protein